MMGRLSVTTKQCIYRAFGRALLALTLLAAGPASACNCFFSEASHMIFGAVLGGTITWGADELGWQEHRALIGFGVASAGGFIEQATNHYGYSWVDTGFNMLGAAIGAYVTDGYLLAPVVRKEANGEKFVGVMVQAAF
jgi:hypothetical protein